jgi:hypothetical protein
MHEVIQEMVNRGWSMYMISSRSGINQSRLERGVLGVREEKSLLRLAEEEAGFSVDDLDQE